VASRADAEDLTQLTFERALRAWGRYDPTISSPATWLLTIARNTLIDHYRKDRRSKNVPLDECGTELSTDPDDISQGVSTELANALASLSRRDREIIALRYGADLTGPEIATIIGLTLANVQQITSRALRKMRSILDAAD
jgi:RNA polymerase sigma factor (sigma-70 family)